MGTLVCFHAHPDDEAISTGGSMARAVEEGHRVVLVVATNGDHGEVPDDLLPGETLIERRHEELARSAEVLGVDRVVWLGYRDSGMTGWEQNSHVDSFMLAPVEQAAEKLAEILREEQADVVTVYDWHGNYGHPDHVQVHRVGHRAAELAGTPTVFEATMNRDVIVRQMQAAMQSEDSLMPDDFDPTGPADDGNPFGTPEAELTHAVDVSAYVDLKRAAITCHASQVTDVGMFLSMPTDIFALAFGTEYFIKHGQAPGLQDGWLFE
jgi:LmbE family N-acetylglucosaminyl deacetylase